MSATSNQQSLTITQLTQQIKQTLQSAFTSVWVEGEISNFSRSGAGHCYLTLKDERSQLRTVIWRDTAARIPFELHDGLQVLVQGSVDVYEGRGQYQLRVRQLQPKGLGPLELAFRQLQVRLEQEGLFRPEIKRPIPTIPKRIAVITSPQAAALRDFLEVALRRWQNCEIILLPVPVQGDQAAPVIAQALEHVCKLPVDLVALIRGGGSLEDLWSFNEEVVARAIRSCIVPVVTGVGHEIDVTIADLVSDLRALTPTEAAERIFPDVQQIRHHLDQWERRLLALQRQYLDSVDSQLRRIETARCFRRPQEVFEEQSRRVDELERSLCRASSVEMKSKQQQLDALITHLDSLSPLRVLQRGYSLTTDERGEIIRDTHAVSVGQSVMVRLVDGEIRCDVTEILEGSSATQSETEVAGEIGETSKKCPS